MPVRFEEPKKDYTRLLQGEGGAVTRLFISLGLGRTPKGARNVMLFFTVLLLAGAGYFIYEHLTKPKPILNDEEKLILEVEMDRLRRSR